jgi:single-stranded-DNA-specific exonuclease
MLRTTKVNIKDLASQAGVSPITAKILVNRGIDSALGIKKFMRTKLEDMHDELLMKDMDKGTEIIKEAIVKGKRIVIYGDYDADGVTSTVILYKALMRCGANVQYYIPHRENEGYGMCSSRVEKLKKQGFEVILTCDNGISALEEIKLARQLDMSVVITDHHELPFIDSDNGDREYIMPDANAIINPKRKDCEYPFKLLCGAGIAYKFSRVLYKKFNIDVKETDELIQYAGIGTICDVVDLVDENRVLAKKSLELITNTKNIGLKALKQAIGLEGKEIKSYNIGFQVGPCINATGRLQTADLSVELLLANDENRAKELANTLYDLNKKRQDMTTENVEVIVEMIKHSELKNDKVIVVYKEDIHESIAGIVAGRVREIFNLPSIIITKGQEMPKGSGRSIDEYNLFEELIKCKKLMNKFGGHPMAAGLSLKLENIELLREQLNKNCMLTHDDITPKIRIDNRLPLNYISQQLISELEKLEPFGKGNPGSLLAEKNISVEKINILGKNRNTLKFRFRIPNTNKYIDGICFNRVEEFCELLEERYGYNYENILRNPKGLKLDIIFTPYINEYNGYKSIQLKIIDFRIS